MQYVSTRATSASASRNPETFSSILLGGLAPDGGLFMPAEYPRVSGEELDAWRTLSYAELAYEILRKFATDIPDADLKALTRRPTRPTFSATPAPGKRRARSRRCAPWKTRAGAH